MINVRERTESLEELILSPMGFKTKDSKGRLKAEEKCPVRGDFARDRDRIIHSKAFRRLKHKTQVFISWDNDHYRTRLTHTLEVSQIARTIARALGLNEDLVEAICLGHDLGHTPFGHAGEKALDCLNPHGFKHYEQSLRVVDVLERNGEGMNLTYEVRDGIVSHTGNTLACTNEGIVVKYADRFAYINHDIDDALRAGVIAKADLPDDDILVLGNSQSSRINTLILDMVEQSEKQGKICMSSAIETKMLSLRKFMFDAVYTKLNERDSKAYSIIESLYEYFYANPSKMPEEYIKILQNYDVPTAVCDYVSGMTDNYCTALYDELFL